MATLEQIETKMKKLRAQADALIAKRSSTVIANIQALMSKHGLTIADIDTHLGGKKRGPKHGTGSADAKEVSAPKYRDPKTGATWSGRGRAPGWIANTAILQAGVSGHGDQDCTLPGTQ
jgi:DNA-binding protein H-NS